MKKEFSKVLLNRITAITVVVIVYSMVMMAITKDLSPLEYIIPALFTELGVATGFYFNKAKAENRIKLMKKNGVEPTNEDFRDGV